MDCSLPGSSVHRISQASILEWVTISFSRKESESEVAQSCPTLCDPIDCSLPGSSVHGIVQARILEWLSCPPPGDLPDPGIESVSPVIPALQADSLLLSHWGNPNWLKSLLLQSVSESEVGQSCPTLCDPIDCSLLDSSIHGIFQARVLKWVAISFSRGSSWSRDWTHVSHCSGSRFTMLATREAQQWWRWWSGNPISFRIFYSLFWFTQLKASF